MNSAAIKASVIALAAIGLAILGSRFLGSGEENTNEQSPGTTSAPLNNGQDSFEQPGGSSSKAGVSNSVGFVVRDADGNVVESGTVSGN